MKIPFEHIDRIWVTSDTHASHINITRGTTQWGANGEFKLRDFDTPDEMTQMMADNFNSVIPDDGILFHLGDWSFAGEQNIERFRKMLDVKEIHLITGNHDHHIERGNWEQLFASRQKYLELEIGKINLILFHFPIASWNNIRKGSFHLHGHQHFQDDVRFGNGKMMDVGVDGNNLFPYKLTDVLSLLADRIFVAENDHHA